MRLNPAYTSLLCLALSLPGLALESTADAEEVVVGAPLTLTIDGAVELALENNLDLRIARESSQRARYDDWSALTNFFPRLSGTVTYSHYKGPLSAGGGGGGFGPMASGDIFSLLDSDFGPEDGYPQGYGAGDIEIDSYSTVLTLSQPIFNGGAIYWGKVMAGTGRDLAELALIAAHQSAILAARRAYLEVLEVEEYVAVQQSNYESLLRHYELTRAMAEVDLVSRADKLRAVSELAAAEKSLLSARNALRLTRANLADILGVELPAELTLVPVAVEPVPFTHSLEEAREEARRANPALTMTERSLRLAEAKVGLTASAFWPRVNLQVSYGWNQGDEFTFSKDDDYWTVGVAASLQIFSSTQRLADLKSARASQRISELEALQTERAILLGVEATYLSLEESLKQIQVSVKQLEAAEEAMELTEGLYVQEIISNIEYLDMNLTYLRARLGEISSRYAYMKARDSLDSMLGRLEAP